MNTLATNDIMASLAHRFRELYKTFHACLSTFPKQERYTIGQRIEQTLLDALEFTLSATYLQRQIKIPILRRASDKTDLLKYLIRLAYETHSINIKRYIVLEREVVEIGKMLGGWIRSI